MNIKRVISPLLFFSKKEKDNIVSAIRQAEKQTSAEIRVHLEKEFRGDCLKHAREIFARLRMHQTSDRNGILILLCLGSRHFVVLGDQGIHARVSQGFWDDIVEGMREKFEEDRFADGIVEAIQRIGEKLQTYFPYQRDDTNELPDGISYSL